MIGGSDCPKGLSFVLRVLKKWLFRVWVLASLVAVGLGTYVAYWLQTPLVLRSTEVVDLVIPSGASAQQIAQRMQEAGVDSPAWWLQAGLWGAGQLSKIKAGSYEIEPGATPLDVFNKLTRHLQAVRRVTLIEGWNYRQVTKALKSAPHLTYDLPDTPAATMRLLGLSGQAAEGRFFPDTYIYPKHEKASVVLRQAAQLMDKQLAKTWAARHPDLPIKTPQEALILASLIEKETGAAADRARIAGVFVNRLRIGMRLQTDPSVIYGLGESFDGNLRKRDLQTDTPYNTYTRAGLPPTPIAMPGAAALKAAVQPDPTSALYFVARGDGSSHFSATLDEHNQAVRRYILAR